MNPKKVAAPLLIIIILATSGYFIYKKYYENNEASLQASGTIEATSVELNAKVNGTIKSIAVKEGDQVKARQLVAELLRNDLAAQKERDALNVQVAEAHLQDLLSGARVQEINEAQANVNIALRNLEKAEQDLDRAETLFSEGAVAQESRDQARLNADLKKNQLAAAQARLNLLEEGSRSEVISGAQAELERNKAVLKASQALLDDLKIISPIEGTVISKNYEPGEYVAMGSSLATIADLKHLWIKVYIPTDDLPQIKLDQPVDISVSGSGRSFSGQVTEIASQGEFTPKTIQTKKERTNIVYAVKISLENTAGLLKPGMPADISFKRGAAK